MLQHQNSEHIFNLLKQAMRTKKVTYKELAAKLQCSESALKRSFGEQRLSTDRLFHLLDALSMSLSELLERWDSGFETKVFPVPEDLDHFFAENFKLFGLFRDLQKEVISENDLPVGNYIKKDLDLLYEALWKTTAFRGRTMRELRLICLKFPKDSKTKDKICKEWGLSFFEEAVSTGSRLDSLVWSQHLSQQDAFQFEEELRELLNKYTSRSSIYKMSLKEVEPEFSFAAAFGFKTFETGHADASHQDPVLDSEP